MKKLLSLPPNPAKNIKSIYSCSGDDWYCGSDPDNRRIGSGGGTAWLLKQWKKDTGNTPDKERCLIIHACGESRRLPAYAPWGKIFTPIPVFRWAVGQSIDQTLLSLQMPVYEEILSNAPQNLRVLIASGDVYIRFGNKLPEIPDADVVCLGMWVEPARATNHGVFVIDKNCPQQLDYMIQKPSIDCLAELSVGNYFLMDIGVWLLSSRALDLLNRLSTDNGEIKFCDLYSQFGCALGVNPKKYDSDINSLKVAIVDINEGGFYHFGTSSDMINSTMALQNLVIDQRKIFHSKIKPHPAIFTQNCLVNYNFTPVNSNIWVENSHVGNQWVLTHDNIITGVPSNDWQITLPPGVCLDTPAIGDKAFAVRPYGINDTMRGSVSSPSTQWMGRSIIDWFTDRGLEIPHSVTDIQNAPLFPVTEDFEQIEAVIRWMIAEPHLTKGKDIWLECRKISANGITAEANLQRMEDQRLRFRDDNIRKMMDNHDRSVFYQLNLADVAAKMKSRHIAPHDINSQGAIKSMRNNMLHYAITGNTDYSDKAFNILSDAILANRQLQLKNPRLSINPDQIVWSRSPSRIDIAGGWTDTPPFSLTNGGNVVNIAIEMNGQQPLQVFIKPYSDRHIIIRSIDMGANELIKDFSALTDFRKVGSPFSIPKAALSLMGFAPQYNSNKYKSLQQLLDEFGSGLEITLLSAIPAGSGLGTSSILASTVLGAINEFAGTKLDKAAICNLTLAIEQLLTTGGGWQDQYGGVLNGIKLLSTKPGIDQTPNIRWLPDNIFTSNEYAPCHLLYYTGLTRVAKGILAEIVKRMFLNDGSQLRLLEQMKYHALEIADAIQRNDFKSYGLLVAETWKQNMSLDSGTNPPSVQNIISRISDLCYGLKLPGAGGGGFIYMVAKDPEAASRIKHILNSNPPNNRARFVDMNISRTGMQVSRS